MELPNGLIIRPLISYLGQIYSYFRNIEIILRLLLLSLHIITCCTTQTIRKFKTCAFEEQKAQLPIECAVAV